MPALAGSRLRMVMSLFASFFDLATLAYCDTMTSSLCSRTCIYIEYKLLGIRNIRVLPGYKSLVLWEIPHLSPTYFMYFKLLGIRDIRVLLPS